MPIQGRLLVRIHCVLLAGGHVMRVTTKSLHTHLQSNVNVKLFKTVYCLRPMPDAYDWYGTLVMRKR